MAGAALVIYQWAVARPLWLDEEMIAINLRERGLLALIGRLSPDMVAPYGWLVLERLTLVTFGAGERALRLFPLLFGLATIATALWIGARWLNAVGASVLVLLCSFGQWVTYSCVELKHYSADMCFALLLPALAAEGVRRSPTRVRPQYTYAYWWGVAAIAQFFGNGALFVTPACAVVIVAVALSRSGVRAAVHAALPGVVWLAAFAVNYTITLRPARGSEFLQGYWAFALPPASAGVVETVRWIGERLVPFARKPGGAAFGLVFWGAAVAGFAVARERQRPLALLNLTVPLSAFALAAVGVLPFFERLVLWVVPALYVGVALLADRSVPAAVAAVRLKPDAINVKVATDVTVAPGVSRIYATSIALFIAVVVCADVVYHGLDDLRARPQNANHQLDDRAAVRWLAAQQRPGDVWMTTRLALPALWWYGDSAIGPQLEASYAAPGSAGCRSADLRDALKGVRRVIVYFGFRFDDVPKGFDDLLLERLADIGSLVAYRPFADAGRAAIVDLTEPSRRDRSRLVRPDATEEDARVKLDGCIAVRPALR
jgi:hypothetical protein